MAQVPSGWGDPTIIPNLLAEHMVRGVDGITIDSTYLSNAISEVTPETQTLGSALLTVSLIDPAWKIFRSGLCDFGPNGLLPQVDVNYPEGTPVWWRLAMFDVASFDEDSGQPNLMLTFQHRIISQLMQCWGPLGWPHHKAGTTRAQFIKMLASKLRSELPKSMWGPGAPPEIQFVCPEINEIQPVASSGVYGTEVVTEQSAAAQAAGINKLPGLTAATKVTIKGAKPSQAQVQNLNTALGVATGLKSPPLATLSMVFAGIAENSWTTTPDPNNPKHHGVFQSTSYAADDVAGAANGFLTGGPSFGGGGAIKLANSGITDPIAIAQTVEGGGSYASESGYSQFLPEAKAIVNAFSGDLSGLTTTANSDVAQLTRGTPDDPDEDSWTCMQRLTSEVNSMIFSDPSPAPGVWGNYLYYIDGPTCIAQRPSLYVALSDDGTTWSATDPSTGKTIAGDGVVTAINGTGDNTAFIREQTRNAQAATNSGTSAKVQKATRIQTPQTPTQIMFNIICGVLEFNAGQVCVVHNAGGLKGRWILEDVTHNSIGDLFAQFTLGPSTYPYPEPQANTAVVSGPNGQPTTVSTGGSASGVGAGVALSLGDIAGYVNPLGKLANLQPERIDQGVDYAGQGTLLALGAGKVYSATATGSGWPHGGYVGYTLSDGLFKGKSVYVAENLTPLVRLGQIVQAGDPIATLADAFPNLETGWAAGTSDIYGTLAQTLGQNGLQTGQSSDPGGVQSAAGRDFNKLLVALGAKSGGPGSGPLSSGPGMPASWPSLSKMVTKGVGSAVGSGAAGAAAVVVKGGAQVVSGTPVNPGGVFDSLFGR